ncbi:TetR/AcrR family transcriptional regulator [Streptomyces sp. ZAF1911]|uniref:TetR/AcrR family transcriptional regulator n=1 Tax=unclassified Streptomyces TaxID=2593676 RepID=UPI00202E40C3|nr:MULTISPECIES: TetR/AcrR family transcriptional regulator [unclassified Streptomyces]MCM1971831.1 TetR/AcrR family transcriptional regulator [Streptomyces sp. G1]MCX5130265.1 TetR/AcrR family transcriptional regulator [Streptomyces sp. NBC_00347]MCX5301647.1 TetR/AcrR family transcriptional regulator [Streptomyces sp. NBC_00193]MDD9382877.1 TetR/AcrR family transcriptional regulator [Streptomyces sp. ZAF1911]
MTLRERRVREQAQRRQLILTTAREMAEAEGWDFVTTRRLAERIEYSQPVLYQHFKNKDAIVNAVALEGFTELTAALHAARLSSDDPHAALDAVARAYADFAARGPVLYEAMLTLDVGLEHSEAGTPQPLLTAFAEIRQAVEPVAADRDPDLVAEVLWSAWHGLATLTWGRRLRPDLTRERLAALTDILTGPAARTP